MYRGHTVGVVIPAYNEEPFVRETVVTVPTFVDRIYVIDDASTDGTWDEIQKAVELDRHRADEATSDEFDGRVVPIQHESNRGVGGAIKTGYLRARDDGLAATAVMGGDGQMDPSVLGQLFDPIIDGEADYVKGNRLAGRRDAGDMPPFRFVGNAVLGALTKIASGYWSTGDPQSGYTAISYRALHEADIDDMYEFYGYCNDLLVKLNVARLRVVDIPNPIIYGDEKSHIKYHTYIPRVSLMLLRNFVWRLKTNYLTFGFHPLVIAYAMGVGASAIGVLGLAWTLVSALGPGLPVAEGLLSVLVFTLGILSLVGAMSMDIDANRDLDSILLPSRGSPTGGGSGVSERAGDAAAANGSGQFEEHHASVAANGEITHRHARDDVLDDPRLDVEPVPELDPEYDD
ncbi:glycosyltransferase family 2 protein [Halobaculum limi]|uniref:glycosyltransferase family 2 protein n=1 Tax=Halobaculum limi TaxID=3031916 RepID=UPI002AA29FC9|nr:glycosyltransferase family 2 protein [Halobaculum sp. YSMS11]